MKILKKIICWGMLFSILLTSSSISAFAAEDYTASIDTTIKSSGTVEVVQSTTAQATGEDVAAYSLRPYNMAQFAVVKIPFQSSQNVVDIWNWIMTNRYNIDDPDKSLFNGTAFGPGACNGHNYVDKNSYYIWERYDWNTMQTTWAKDSDVANFMYLSDTTGYHHSGPTNNKILQDLIFGIETGEYTREQYNDAMKFIMQNMVDCGSNILTFEKEWSTGNTTAFSWKPMTQGDVDTFDKFDNDITNEDITYVYLFAWKPVAPLVLRWQWTSAQTGGSSCVRPGMAIVNETALDYTWTTYTVDGKDPDFIAFAKTLVNGESNSDVQFITTYETVTKKHMLTSNIYNARNTHIIQAPAAYGVNRIDSSTVTGNAYNHVYALYTGKSLIYKSATSMGTGAVKIDKATKWPYYPSGCIGNGMMPNISVYNTCSMKSKGLKIDSGSIVASEATYPCLGQYIDIKGIREAYPQFKINQVFGLLVTDNGDGTTTDTVLTSEMITDETFQLQPNQKIKLFFDVWTSMDAVLDLMYLADDTVLNFWSNTMVTLYDDANLTHVVDPSTVEGLKITYTGIDIKEGTNNLKAGQSGWLEYADGTPFQYDKVTQGDLVNFNALTDVYVYGEHTPHANCNCYNDAKENNPSFVDTSLKFVEVACGQHNLGIWNGVGQLGGSFPTISWHNGFIANQFNVWDREAFSTSRYFPSTENKKYNSAGEAKASLLWHLGNSPSLPWRIGIEIPYSYVQGKTAVPFAIILHSSTKVGLLTSNDYKDASYKDALSADAQSKCLLTSLGEVKINKDGDHYKQFNLDVAGDHYGYGFVLNVADGDPDGAGSSSKDYEFYVGNSNASELSSMTTSSVNEANIDFAIKSGCSKDTLLKKVKTNSTTDWIVEVFLKKLDSGTSKDVEYTPNKTLSADNSFKVNMTKDELIKFLSGESEIPFSYKANLSGIDKSAKLKVEVKLKIYSATGTNPTKYDGGACSHNTAAGWAYATSSCSATIPGGNDAKLNLQVSNSILENEYHIDMSDGKSSAMQPVKTQMNYYLDSLNQPVSEALQFLYDYPALMYDITIKTDFVDSSNGAGLSPELVNTQKDCAIVFDEGKEPKAKSQSRSTTSITFKQVTTEDTKEFVQSGSWYTYFNITDNMIPSDDTIYIGSEVILTTTLNGNEYRFYVNSKKTEKFEESADLDITIIHTPAPEDRLPWNMSGGSNKSYAEIVANEVGYRGSALGDVVELSQDWNVLQGIPSTENLSVAAGGKMFEYAFAGWDYGRGKALDPESNLYINNTEVDANGIPFKNAVNSTAAVKREIKFKVVVENIWGNSNDLCTLSCPGHTWDVYSANGKSTPSKPTNVSKGSSPKSPKPWTCTVCNATGNYTYTPGKDEKTDSEGNKIPATYGRWNGGHTCSWSGTVKYDCSDGTWDTDGNGIKKTSDEKNYGDNLQNFIGSCDWETVPAITGGASSGTVTYDSSTDLCEQYTSGTGCQSSCKTNCVHNQTITKEFTLIETLDIYAYRTITNTHITNLIGSKIVNYNEDLLENCVGDGSTNIASEVTMWRGVTEYDVSDPNGRILFTMFKSPIHTGAWKSTTITNGYYFGNCTITFKVDACSFKDGEGKYNIGFMESGDSWMLAKPDTMDSSYSSSNGNDYGLNVGGSNTKSRYKQPKGCDSLDLETNYENDTGDYMTDTDITVLACEIVGEWMSKNQGTYAANVISDQLMFGAETNAGAEYQSLVGKIYANDKIPLFNRGFDLSTSTIYRNHSSASGDTTLKDFIASYQYSKEVPNIKSTKDDIATGYTGVPNSNSDPLDKYKTTGKTTDIESMLIYDLMCITNGAGINPTITQWDINGVKISNGTLTDATSRSYYHKPIALNSPSAPGITKINVYTRAEGNDPSNIVTEEFQGTYRNHIYNNKGSYEVMKEENGTAPTVLESGFTDNGMANAVSVTDYDGNDGFIGTALAIQNLDINDDIPNGVYTEPVTVRNLYELIIDMNNDDEMDNYVKNVVADNATCIFSQSYVNADGKKKKINDVVIHNPISCEYWQIIPNNYGAYDDYVVDESGEDMRVSTWNMSEEEKTPYIMLGNTFHLWVTDFGDFYDYYGGWDFTEGASSNLGGNVNDYAGSDVETGEFNEFNPNGNAGTTGYTNDFNTGKFIDSRYVTFSFPVSYIDTSGDLVSQEANTKIDLSTVKYSYKGFGSEDLQEFKDSDDQYKYGWDYEFTALTSAHETNNAFAVFDVEAWNKGSTNTDISPSNYDREDYAAADRVRSSNSFALVGRVGNLTIEDSSDFRYSNLFKVTLEDRYLVDGITLEVDANKAKTIVTSALDILMDDNPRNTFSITSPVIDGVGYGKAATVANLPLSSNLNNIPEYTVENMRFGYNVFLDVETIGKFSGDNYIQSEVETVKSIWDEKTSSMVEYVDTMTVETPNYGPTSSSEEPENRTDGYIDSRDSVIEITPQYYLYDLDEHKFYSIDVYAGNQGSRTLYWSGVSSLIMKPVNELYVDIELEKTRRNITDAEEAITIGVMPDNLTTAGSVFYGKDYIGTASRIRLDMFNRSYIGSPIRYGSSYVSGDTIYFEGGTDVTGNGITSMKVPTTSELTRGQMSVTDWVASAQRWHFTFGLPSSTYITYSGAGYDQLEIEASNERLLSDHPNAVIVCFIDIVAVGGVNVLRYNHKLANDGSTVINIKNSTVDYANCNVYAEDGSTVKDIIEGAWAPLFIYDAYTSSAEDLTVEGTH